jgi:hypothetical protein
MSALFSVGGKFLNIGDPLTFGAGNPLALNISVQGNSYLSSTSTNNNGKAVCWPLVSGGIGPYSLAFSNGATTQNSSLTNFGSFQINTNPYGAPFTDFAFISFNSGTANNTQGATDTLELVVTDSQGNQSAASFIVTYTTNFVLNFFQPNYFLTNYPSDSYGFSIGTWFPNPMPSGATNFTATDPTGTFGISGWALNSAPVISLLNNSTWPLSRTYPITFEFSDTSDFSQILSVEIITNNGPTAIYFVPAVSTISTSLPNGFVIGQANASGTLDNLYQWSLFSGSQYFQISFSGQVTINAAPTAAGSYTLGISCGDGTATYQQSFAIKFVKGNAIPSSNMTVTLLPTSLDNSVSSGTLATPTVTGFTPAYWSFTSPYGTGGRYTMNGSTGEITITAALSYQVAADGTSFEDELTIYATDLINTCVRTVPIPVTQKVGPTINIGPPTVLEAAGVTGYATFKAAFDALGVSGTNPNNVEPGTTFVAYSYPQNNSEYKTYYLNDGLDTNDYDYGFLGNITFYVPITVMGAPNGPFPYFTVSPGKLTKGFFTAFNFDLTIENLTIAYATYGQGTNSNIGGIYKEGGRTSGNVIVNNCYIHDCDNGVFTGSPGSKFLITGTRISHCGIGEFALTHNIYSEADLLYMSNCLTDQVFNGHLLKCRSPHVVLKNVTLLDGELGCASNIIEIPNGALGSVTDCLLQKGPTSQNPNMLCYAFGGDQANFAYSRRGQHNTLTVTGNTFVLDPGENGLGNYMPGMTDSCQGQDEVIGIYNGSLPGTIDSIPAIVTGSGNSFYGLLSSNYSTVTTVGLFSSPGSINLTGSATLSTRPATTLTFPGTGPDPTAGDPPGPFLQTFYTGYAQITSPVNIVEIAAGAAAGTAVTTVVWDAGSSVITSPVYEIYWSSGPNSFHINSSTGEITLAAKAAAQSTQADTICVYITQTGQTPSFTNSYIWNLVVVVT